MMTTRPPTPLHPRPRLFLAGSIEMGGAPDWQQAIETALADVDVDIWNPRRLAWDDSWPQEASFGPFHEQVTWELEGLERADVVVVFFAPGTMSPISLLELGLLAAQKPARTLVCCAPGFWRKGNVDVVCARYGLQQVDDLAALITEVRRRLALLSPKA
ncbi:MAG: nucleoside 2-deoxyribosyltransferase domain-containing protein [Deltaproteobacteria bacterium]|nr:nucleoside 2-deoxyribosyltransferase domain-containing protein [Deltaproteobacteria bacterium]